MDEQPSSAVRDASFRSTDLAAITDDGPNSRDRTGVWRDRPG
jgi:hypothetical protein